MIASRKKIDTIAKRNCCNLGISLSNFDLFVTSINVCIIVLKRCDYFCKRIR